MSLQTGTVPVAIDHASTETMDRPWRLFFIGLGAAGALATRLLAANSFWEFNSTNATVGLAVSAAIAGLGLLLVTGQRDNVGWQSGVLAATTGLAFAGLYSLSPGAAATGLSETDQTLLALSGASAGILLAGILALGLVRRVPTLSIVLLMVAGLMLFASSTLLRFDTWPSIGLTATSFAATLFAWDRSPRREPRYVSSQQPARTIRSVLCLATIAIGLTSVQLWYADGRNLPRASIVLGVIIVTVCVAAGLAIRLLSETKRERVTTGEWSSWFTQIRANQFDAIDYPTASASHAMAAAAVEAQRPTSARAKRGRPTRKGKSRRARAEQKEQTESGFDWGDTDPNPNWTPADLAPQPTPGPTAVFGSLTMAVDATDAASSAARLEALWGTNTPTPVVHAEPQKPLVESSSLFASATPATSTKPAPRAFTNLLSAANSPGATVKPDPVPGIAGPDEFAAWLQLLQDAPDQWARRMFIAVEVVGIHEYDQFTEAQRSATAIATIGALNELRPAPAKVARIDGPYFILMIEDLTTNQIVDINRHLHHLFKGTIATNDGIVQLDGTLAMLRTAGSVTFDNLVGDAVEGLVQARRLDKRF